MNTLRAYYERVWADISTVGAAKVPAPGLELTA